MKAIQQFLEKLTPRGKLMLAIGGTVLVVGTIVGVAMNAASPERKARAAAKPQVEAILTDEDPRALGLDSIASQLRQLQAQQNRLERVMGQKEKDVQLKNTQEKVSGLEQELQLLQQELARVGREKKGTGEGGDTSSDSSTANQARTPIPPRESAFINKATSSPADLTDVYSNLPPEQPEDPKSRSSEKKETPKIRVIKGKEDEGKSDKPEELSVTLPAGSILSGVLVTGMDAPTGKQAQRDPFPSLIRIKNEAILPNRFRADFRECFLIAGGWGDLSSERAYMRAERLSCVRNDGSVLEASLEAYATGEDGKAGLRGRLVSKQGQIIARSLGAGFLQGIAGAFNVQKVPTINVTRAGDNGDTVTPVYEQAFDSNALQSAGFSGAGSALERIADFYLEMAESIFPVIEIDAMRDVDFIVNKGMTVKFNSTTLKVNDVNQ
ncbi:MULTISPECIES: TraB/VirB10 family protein [Pseudomonas]|uniref:Pilus assembly protein n=1 Tax=Pseudomonas veronii TaxID=76761 RepID=A0A7Y1A7W1_PSEVE|nr:MULTISPECIES: TraB/VirB10 family protein [Pseudomonas]MCT9824024.1 TraB/VirB10 family protein [Pseudomonas veronii]NMY10815.1 pilus assembly protein [Pseudomonas veronii]